MSIACTGCGQSPIPQVPIGSFRNFAAARRALNRKPFVREMFVSAATARGITNTFLRTAVGKRAINQLARTIGLSGEISVTDDVTEELMKAIDAFLKEQRRQRGKNRHPKGMAVPIPRKPKKPSDDRRRINPITGMKMLLLQTRPTEKEEDEQEPEFPSWFERRWRASPGLAFALGMDKRGFPEGNIRRRRRRRRM